MPTTVVMRPTQTAEVDISKHDCCRRPDAHIERPSQHQFQQPSQRIQRDAGRKQRHRRKRNGVEGARLLVEAQLEILGNGARLRPVVKRHHEHAHEHHRRHCAHPIEVAGGHAIFGAGRRHADHLLRAQVGGQKGEAGDPRGNRATREKEVLARALCLLQPPADAEDEAKVDREDRVVDDS